MTDLRDVERTGQRMLGFTMPWFIAAGWAIDLFLERQTREHHDLEIGVFRADQFALREYLRDWQFEKVENGLSTPWNTGEQLSLPIHEIHAESKDEDHLEILLQELVDERWAFRRNHQIQCELQEAVLISHNGIPFLAPQVVLLFKAKTLRTKDEHDFDVVHNQLDPSHRQWLRAAIAECHPGHQWLNLL